MLSEDGGTEAELLLSLLDLPNATSMMKSSFPQIEYDLVTHIKDLTKELLEKNLCEEVRHAPQSDSFDFD